MGPEILAIMMVFGIPITAIITSHMRKMAEIKSRRDPSGDAAAITEIRALKEQFQELRDTTTKYDMSFDAALQRIENRVNHLEGRVSRVEQDSASATQVSRTQ